MLKNINLFIRNIRVGPPHGNPSMGPPVTAGNVVTTLPTSTPSTVIQPQANLAFPPSVPNSRIYVGSINYDLTAEDIKATFAVCGGVVSCQLMVKI